MAPLPPFFNLPGELRNAIYELVVLNAPLRLFEGRVNLPPFAHVCRQIRTEMIGIFEEHEESLILDVQSGRLPIKAKIINYDFVALYKWLERNEGTNDTRIGPLQICAQQVRTLHIDMIIDVPVTDLTRAAESQLTIQDHIVRDREAIQSSNDSWDDALWASFVMPSRRFNFHLGPWVTGRNGTAAIVDGYGAKSYGLRTLQGNCYVVTCNVRLGFLSTSKEILGGAFPSGFCHQGDYLDQLFGQTPDGGPWSPGHQWGSFDLIHDRNSFERPYKHDPASPFFKVIFGGTCRARAGSYWMLWDKKFYSQLTRQQQSVVDHYRFLDGGVERQAGVPLQRDENGFFEKLDAAVKIEDRMDLSE
jgi:hypothetical protein